MPRQITSVQHPLVKHMVRLRQNRDYRYEHRSLLLEGIKPIAEIGGKFHFKTLMMLNETLLPIGIKADEILIVNESIMKKVSGMQTSEGIIAEIEMPEPASLKGLKFIVAFDGIADPGNLGTLLRTALALGWEGAFIIDETCDPFNEKALRAARGATFRLPIAWGNWQMLHELISKNHLNPVVADLQGTPIEKCERKDSILLVLSSESQGVSEDARKVCDPVTIPMPGEMESLNVAIAGGILMYSFLRGDDVSKGR